MHQLSERILAGDPRAVARALRLVDDHSGDWLTVLKDVFPSTGRAYVVGITGNPGAGKSTLTDRLIEVYRKAGRKVGVVCVDPSSPYSGGAILGDRIRMSRHALDPGVFIRSVATRGHLGGLSRSARDMVRVLDASGSDVVLVETVGVGQDELEITRTAHSTLVVMAPGLGDEIQAIKAGLLETADVFCVNKADRDGADATIRDLELMIALGTESVLAASRARGHVVHSEAIDPTAGEAAGPSRLAWRPPIKRAVATRGEGITEVVDALAQHREWLETTPEGRARRRARLAEELREALREALIDEATQSLRPALEAAVARVEERVEDPYTATESLVRAFRER
ncbi:MAG: methylmalonyl Co-A mutase-associated GTPase MeaB [Myxococcales bacterium]|nr:methylmalonyl Co-A mutase-associated GTPase MeaB [Myxococcales bacterium]